MKLFKKYSDKFWLYVYLKIKPYIIQAIKSEITSEVRVWGDRNRLHIDPTAYMVNALLNTSSGSITVGEFTFCGHDVSIITGTHYYMKTREERFKYPAEGGDIVIGKGVWIGSNALILGPVVIGDDAVIAAGAVVMRDVPAGTVAAGIPAKIIKKIEFSHEK